MVSYDVLIHWHNQQAKQIERLKLFENALKNNDIKLFKANSTNVTVKHIDVC